MNETNYKNYREHSIKTKVNDFLNRESILSKKRRLAVKSKIDAHIDHNYDEHAMEL